MCDETPRSVVDAAHARWVEAGRRAWVKQTETPMPSETHRRLLTARAIVVRAAGLDPDGGLVPMRPAAVWRCDAVAESREGRRLECRDAALIAALKWT